MFKECKGYLIEKLKEAGIKSKVHTSMKTLKLSQESHMAAVIFSKDSFERANREKRYISSDNLTVKRTKILGRTMSFNVIIGEYDEDKCQDVFQRFLEDIGTGLNVDGNWTSLEVLESEWVDKEDSILNAKISVNVTIEFIGGIYKDTELTPIKDVNITVERSNTNA